MARNAKEFISSSGAASGCPNGNYSTILINLQYFQGATTSTSYLLTTLSTNSVDKYRKSTKHLAAKTKPGQSESLATGQYRGYW
ncbi:MAG: hypothetical protein ACXW00_00140 [Methylobacter sp.]